MSFVYFVACMYMCITVLYVEYAKIDGTNKSYERPLYILIFHFSLKFYFVLIFKSLVIIFINVLIMICYKINTR